MQIKVIYCGMEEYVAPDIGPCAVGKIKVLMDGTEYSVQSALSATVAKEVSIDIIMAPLRRQIMGAIEQKLFGDFNRRDF